MDRTAADLMRFLDDLGVSKWGVAELSADLHPLGAQFARAISLIHACPFQMETYDEGRFHEQWEVTRATMEQAVGDLLRFLADRRIPHLAPRGQDEGALTATFPHKLAATRAGLGWIGKSTLLVTREHGPRVRTVAVLVDLDLPCGRPVTQDYCGKCRACVDACTYGCIKNVNWYPGIDRAELLDVHRCFEKRTEFSASLGRRHECGWCMLACPIGR